MSHNTRLDGVSLAIKNFKCFDETGTEEFYIYPINVIIGKNNSGKSAIIDVMQLCVSKGEFYNSERHARGKTAYNLTIGQNLDQASLLSTFPKGGHGGNIPGSNHWQYGQKLIGKRLVRDFDNTLKPKPLIVPELDGIHPSHRAPIEARLSENAIWPFDKMKLIRIGAERDVVPEPRSKELMISPTGRGTTNVIRAFINQASLPRNLVEAELLGCLNKIYAADSVYSRISCREDGNDNWEIFIGEKNKGEIRLSESGSSLKSIFIILGFLILIPHLKRTEWNNVIFSIEEPENNLHPALFRRLIDFLSEMQAEKRFILL